MPENNTINDAVDVTLKQVKEGESMALSLVEGLKGQGNTLKIERQKLPNPDPKTPVKRPANQRNHTFFTLDSFVAYLNKYGIKGDVVVFADPSNGNFVGVLQETPETERELIDYQPRKTIDYKFLADRVGKNLKLSDFCQTLRRLRDYVQNPHKKLVTSIYGQLSIAKKVEDASSLGSKGTFGSMIKIEAKGGDGQAVELPESLKIAVKPYMDSEETVTFEVFIDLRIAGGDQACFYLDSPDCERVFEAALNEALPKLNEGLKELDCLVTVGTPTHIYWDYLQNK